jgi:hypothetical protein
MEQTPLPIEFSIKTITVEEAPFQLMINTALLNEEHRKGYTWHWMMTLRAFDLKEDGQTSGEEKTYLLNIMQQGVQHVMNHARIQLVGTTLYKGIFEVIFYSKPEDGEQIKEAITALPHALEDRKGRFVKYQGNEDEAWEKVDAYFEVFKK